MTPGWSDGSYRTVPAVLSFAAGYVDGCTFIALFGLFVAQVTGSFVVAGAVLVVAEKGTLIKVLAIPVFIFGVAVATAAAWVARHMGWRVSPIVLGLESLLLAGLLTAPLAVPDMNNPDQPAALVAGLCGLCAMGVQSAFVRLLMRGAPSTNVMTTNTTQLARLRRFDRLWLLKSGFCGQKALINQGGYFQKRLRCRPTPLQAQ